MPWLEPLRALRDRLITNPRFRRRIAAYALTRPVARHRARALFDLIAGFVYSQALLACIRLRLFDYLRAGPTTATDIAQQINLPLDATQRLLRAASALHLCEERGSGRYGLGPLGAVLVDDPGLTALIEHHASFYADLSDPVALLRGKCGQTLLAHYWPYANADNKQAISPEATQAYTALMSASQGMVAAEILDVYPLRGHRCLLDMGGGDGSFIIAAAARTPGLRFILNDLPSVIETARGRLSASGLAGRTAIVGGDFLRDPLPDGADIISLVRVLHDHGDEAALRILRAARAALPPDGTVLIAEPMLLERSGDRVGNVYFAFYFHAMGQGRLRTRAEVRRLLNTAGFANMRVLRSRLPMITSVVTARAQHVNIS
jgi:demethylspheroidene O-methyltransferase